MIEFSKIAKELVDYFRGLSGLKRTFGMYDIVDLKIGFRILYQDKNGKQGYIKIFFTFEYNQFELFDIEFGRIESGKYKTIDINKDIIKHNLKPTIIGKFKEIQL